MSSREQILNKIRTNKPETLKLPKIDKSLFTLEDTSFEMYSENVGKVGGTCFKLASKKEVISRVQDLFPKNSVDFCAVEGLKIENKIDIDQLKSASDLENLDIVILEGAFGVVENGAVWIADSQIPVRVMPFITQHLIFVINERSLVETMHEAYNNESVRSEEFGVFISGPSKTADIEQSLVLGAQGAMSLTVFVLE